MDTAFWFMFLAKPLPDTPDYADTGGAYINIWVAHSDHTIAERLARDAIIERAWNVERLEKQALVCREDYLSDSQQMEYFGQAMVDGYCLVFHCWPPDAEDAEDDTL